MTKHSTIRNLLIASVLTLTGACSAGDEEPPSVAKASPEEHPHSAAPEIWKEFAQLSTGAVEAERFESLSSMSQKSDVIVRAKVLRIEVGATAPASTSGEVPFGAKFVLGVSEVINGDPVRDENGTVSFEMPTFARDSASLDQRVQELNAKRPDHESLFFLRDKGELATRAGMSSEEVATFRGKYRLVNFSGLIGNLGGTASLVLRLDPHEDGVAPDVDNRPFEDVAASAKSHSRRPR